MSITIDSSKKRPQSFVPRQNTKHVQLWIVPRVFHYWIKTFTPPHVQCKSRHV